MKPTKCHTHFTRGKRLLVVLRDGTSFVSKFVERTDKHVILEDRTVRHKDLRTISIYKERPTSSMRQELPSTTREDL